SKSVRLTWEEARKKIPKLTKGWYELSQLDASIRFDFFRDYWFNSLPYHPNTFAFIDRFFKRVKEVPILAINQEIFLVYFLKDSSDLFLGRPPLIDQQIENLQETIDFPLPKTFLKFYRIHNGFMRVG